MSQIFNSIRTWELFGHISHFENLKTENLAQIGQGRGSKFLS